MATPHASMQLMTPKAKKLVKELRESKQDFETHWEAKKTTRHVERGNTMQVTENPNLGRDMEKPYIYDTHTREANDSTKLVLNILGPSILHPQDVRVSPAGRLLRVFPTFRDQPVNPSEPPRASERAPAPRSAPSRCHSARSSGTTTTSSVRPAWGAASDLSSGSSAGAQEAGKMARFGSGPGGSRG